MKIGVQGTNDLGLVLGMLLARLWLGLRSVLTGIEKFAGTRMSEQAVTIDGAANAYGLTESAEEKLYSFSAYAGVPQALYDKLAKEPLIPQWSLAVFDWALGPALILLGLTVLLGIGTRISLFAMGLLYTGLTAGLILLKQDAGIAWLGVHIVLIVMALALSKYDRLALLKKW